MLILAFGSAYGQEIDSQAGLNAFLNQNLYANTKILGNTLFIDFLEVHVPAKTLKIMPSCFIKGGGGGELHVQGSDKIMRSFPWQLLEQNDSLTVKKKSLQIDLRKLSHIWFELITYASDSDLLLYFTTENDPKEVSLFRLTFENIDRNTLLRVVSRLDKYRI